VPSHLDCAIIRCSTTSFYAYSGRNLPQLAIIFAASPFPPHSHLFLQISILLSYWCISIDFSCKQSRWAQGRRIRCRRCFSASYISRGGRILREKTVFSISSTNVFISLLSWHFWYTSLWICRTVSVMIPRIIPEAQKRRLERQYAPTQALNTHQSGNNSNNSTPLRQIPEGSEGLQTPPMAHRNLPSREVTDEVRTSGSSLFPTQRVSRSSASREYLTPGSLICIP
jgi:hypothetical protein